MCLRPMALRLNLSVDLPLSTLVNYLFFFQISNGKKQKSRQLSRLSYGNCLKPVALRPILSDSLPLSTFMIIYSLFCLLYSLN